MECDTSDMVIQPTISQKSNCVSQPLMALLIAFLMISKSNPYISQGNLQWLVSPHLLGLSKSVFQIYTYRQPCLITIYDISKVLLFFWKLWVLSFLQILILTVCVISTSSFCGVYFTTSTYYIYPGGEIIHTTYRN